MLDLSRSVPALLYLCPPTQPQPPLVLRPTLFCLVVCAAQSVAALQRSSDDIHSKDEVPAKLIKIC